MLAGFTFTRQTDPVSGIHARRDFNRQGFGLLNAAVTMTFIARIFNQRTASLTVRTGLLYRKEALTHLDLACAMTGRTGLRFAASFGAAAVADVALFQRRNTDLFGDATYRFFQRQLHVVTEIGAARRALPATSAAKDIAENIAKDIAEVRTAAKTAAAAHAALLKGRVAVLIVGRTLLGISQDFIRFFDFFKFGFSLFITLVAVRVIFHGQALISLFDFTLFRCFGNA